MTKTKTNPEMRFAGFTEDWIPSKLGNIGEVKMCKRIFNNQTSPKGDIPFFKIGTFGKKADSYISKELYQEFRTKYPFPKKGDILLSAAGTLGRIVVYDGKPAYFQDSNIVWLNNDQTKVLNEFLYYIYGNITYDSEGGTIQRLYNSIILNARFSFPESKPEQKLIGNFFENIDKLISEHQQKHEKLKLLKHAMLNKMFPKQGQLVPEIRFKGFLGDWEEKKLGDLGEFIKGKGFSKDNVANSGKFECVLYGHLYTEYDMLIEKIHYSTDIELNTAIKSKYGDILFPSSTTTPTGVARASCIEKEGVILGGDINILRPNSMVLGRFLSFNINANRNKLIPLIKGITVRHIYNSDLATVKIYVPNSIEEQRYIGNYFKNLDELIEKQEISIRKIQNINKAFLSKMFT